MLVIRMQRTGRKGHAMFRIVVQDSRRTPTSGKVVAALGSYDPHAKSVIINKEKAAFYMEHGAQPSERVARLLKAQGVKLPSWVVLSADKERTVRNADKRRSTSPAAPAEEAAPQEAEESEAVATPDETPVVDAAEVEVAAATEEVPAEAEQPSDEAATEIEPSSEAPAEEAPAESAQEAEAAEKPAK